MPRPEVSTHAPCEKTFALSHYDLAATLTSGQAFRWRNHQDTWIGVIGSHWIQLHSRGDSLIARAAEPMEDWSWLAHYLQVELDLQRVLASFPDDEPMRRAVESHRGLRLLRQDPWECLASFILSSTKQIVQIRQIIALLCERFGKPIAVPGGHPPERAFPTPERLAETTEVELRACKMGFRAPYLLAAARMIASRELELSRLHQMTALDAQAELLKIPGVGPKITDCVLLFAYGFQEAFPVDVWVMKALRELYFPRRRPSRAKLQHFTKTHFGPNAGYAQQYLFHYMRMRAAY